MVCADERLCYFTQLHVDSPSPDAPVFPLVARTLWHWLMERESCRTDEPLLAALCQHGARERFLAGSMDVHDDGSPTWKADASHLLVNALVTDGAPVPGSKPPAGAVGTQDGAARGDDSRTPRATFALWAMEYDERDETSPLRRIRTKVGISHGEDTDTEAQLSVTVSAYLLPSLTLTPEPPLATHAPEFVRALVADKTLRCHQGDVGARSYVTLLEANDFEHVLASRDNAKTEGLPRVVLTTRDHGRRPLVDVGRLTDALVGLANVYLVEWESQASDDTAEQQTMAVDPRVTPRLAPGSLYVRSSVMGLERTASHDDATEPDKDPEAMQWHAFLADELDRHEPSEVIRLLCIGLSRCALATYPVDVSTATIRTYRALRSCEEREAQQVLLVSRARENRELIDTKFALMDKRHESLSTYNESLAMRYDHTQREMSDYQELAESYQDDLSDLKSKLTLIQGGGDSSGQAAPSATAPAAEPDRSPTRSARGGKAQAPSGQGAATRDPDEMPALERACVDVDLSLSDLLAVVEHRYATRLVILPEAFKSAQQVRGCTKSLRTEGWKMLLVSATILWKLHFGVRSRETSGDIYSQFREKTGFELALTESKSTKDDKKLMRSRKRMYRGREISCVAHIKGKSSKPESALRLYYYADVAERKIVIGHFGKHLDTAGTAKLA